MDTIINHLKSTWRYWFSVVYFTVLIVVLAAVYSKHSVKPPAPEPVVVMPAATVDLEPVNKRLAALEQDLANHTSALKALRSEYDAAVAVNHRLERRTQSHLEAIKRMCEYIVVITVDKKIIPRQCLPEYRWSQVEGN